MFTTRPALLFLSSGSTALVISQGPRTFTAITLSQVAASSSSILRPPELVIAALFTRQSSFFNRPATRFMDFSFDKSIERKSAPISLAVFLPSAKDTSAITTSAPAAMAASAKARPSPRAPPVTRTRLFFKFTDLLPRLHLQHAAHARHAGIVLVEELAA